MCNWNFKRVENGPKKGIWRGMTDSLTKSMKGIILLIQISKWGTDRINVKKPKLGISSLNVETRNKEKILKNIYIHGRGGITLKGETMRVTNGS